MNQQKPVNYIVFDAFCRLRINCHRPVIPVKCTWKGLANKCSPNLVLGACSNAGHQVLVPSTWNAKPLQWTIPWLWAMFLERTLFVWRLLLKLVAGFSDRAHMYTCADLISALTPGPLGHKIHKKTPRSQTGQWMHESYFFLTRTASSVEFRKAMHSENHFVCQINRICPRWAICEGDFTWKWDLPKTRFGNTTNELFTACPSHVQTR